MTCRVCASVSAPVFTARVHNEHDVIYFRCDTCGFICTEEPYWLNAAYAHPITLEDTGILVRNQHFAKVVSCLLFFCFDRNARFLDYAGGYGLFTRMMRDVGFDYYWHDKHTPNLVARGFEAPAGVPFELVTAFEVAEHFVDPLAGFQEILALSRNLVFSTLLLPEPVPDPGTWWYYGLEHGQHVSLYSRESLARIAQKHDLAFHTNGIDLHLMT